MLAHPDDFMPFIPSITGEDSAGATDDGMMSEKDFKKYCSLVAETGEWGGEPEVSLKSLTLLSPLFPLHLPLCSFPAIMYLLIVFRSKPYLDISVYQSTSFKVDRRPSSRMEDRTIRLEGY
jgi:hypothetical protein